MANTKKNEKENQPELTIDDVKGRREPVSIGEEVDKIIANNPYAASIEITISISIEGGERRAIMKHLVSDDFKQIMV